MALSIKNTAAGFIFLLSTCTIALNPVDSQLLYLTLVLKFQYAVL